MTTFVHSLSAAPPPRYDSAPWTSVRLEESANNVTFATVETQSLPLPLDDDPTHPATRHLTTSLSTIASGFMRVVFLDDDANESPPSPSTVVPGVVEDGYPALEAILVSSENESLAALSTEAQLELRASAIRIIERFCNQKFTQEGSELAPVTKTVDSIGGGTVFLPRRLAELDSVSVLGASFLTEEDIRLSDDHSYLYLAPVNLAGTGAGWMLQAQAKIQGAPWRREFPSGDGVASVTGVWGWLDSEWMDGTLAGIARAIRFDMEERADGEASEAAATVRASTALGMKSISQGGVTITRGASPQVSDRVRRELEGYLWEGVLGARA